MKPVSRYPRAVTDGRIEVSPIDDRVVVEVTAPGVPVELAPSLSIVLSRTEATELVARLQQVLAAPRPDIRAHEFAKR